MKQHAALLPTLETWADESGLPRETASHILEACPWLDGTETISTELAADLFDGVPVGSQLSEGAILSLCQAYNAFVERDYLATLSDRESAYAAMKAALAGHGEGLNEPFWIHDDSISSSEPWVFVRAPHLLSEALVQQVVVAASLYAGFSAVNFSLDEHGDKVQRVAIRKNDA